MRWMLVQPGPEFSVHDVYNGWREALIGLGEHVMTFDLATHLTFYDSVAIETGRTDDDGNKEMRKALTHEQAIDLASDRLFAPVYKGWPDVILIVSGFFTPPLMLDILRSRRHKVVMLHTESPYQEQEQLERAAHVDINLLNDPVNIDAYKALGIPVAYSPHAYRPPVHYPRRSLTPQFDLAFSGTGYQSRIDFFEAMNLDGLRVALAGNWIQLTEDSPLREYMIHDPADCLDNETTAELYQLSETGINMYRREAEDGSVQGWAMGPREVEMAASGLWFMRDPRPEGDEILPMLPTFSSPEDASEQLRWWLAHPDERAQAARTARDAVISRTFTSNARMLLRLLDRQPVTI